MATIHTPFGGFLRHAHSTSATSQPISEVTPQRRITGLDGLRGMAALGVVLFHYTQRYQELYGHTSQVPGFSLGRHGVLLFFIISGFVILMTVERAKNTRHFVQSRFARLYPAFWVCALITYLIVHAAGLSERAVSFRELLLNFTMAPRFLGARNVDNVYWTLLVELMFYVLVGALLAVGQAKQITRVLGALVVLAAVDVLFFSNRQIGILGPARNFASMAYCFLIGTMLYRLRQNPTRWQIPATIILACIAFAARAEGPLVCMLAVMFTAIVFMATSRSLPLMESRALVFLGTISYTLYLLHQNIGYVIIRKLSLAGVNSYLAIGIAVAMSIGLATAISFAIERPANVALRYRPARKPQSPSPEPDTQSAVAFNLPDEGLVPA